MATKIKQIVDSSPYGSMLFGTWLSGQGIDSATQHRYTKNGWLNRVSKGVYRIDGTIPTLYATISSYNTQLGKRCEIGAYTALELRGYSHYLSVGKPKAYLFTDNAHKLPSWLLSAEWDMEIDYTTTSFLGEDMSGVEEMSENGFRLLVASPERAIMECLYLPNSSSSLLDIYYIMEGLTTLRPKLVQSLLEKCSSVKVKRLFLYMAEKANHLWYKALRPEAVSLGSGRRMITPTGKYIGKYNMTIPKELAEYE